ncbi:MAG: tetratricopeptide repeat protein [Oscillatoriales cyanobacterium RM2_1_1]|nr:tetratricopeptide repeat protein [Oscillatoriales cyanobacterium RM2_1_1]
MTLIGQLLDRRYRIVQVLGSGAFGQTYLATDTRRPGHPQCVVKQLRPPNNNPTILKTALRLFEQEAEVLEKIGQHDQIPRLLAYFKENNHFYLVEEFIEGHPLSKELISGKPWPEEEVIELLEQILKILVFVHDQGVIHRDISPANLIRRKSNSQLVLIDFGSVKEVSNHLTNNNGQGIRTIATGTPTYMPIEQFQGNPQFNSDIYAAGIIAVQALTGLAAIDLPKLQDPNLARPGELTWHDRTQVSDELQKIIDQMVHHYYGQRYQSALEVIADLRQLTGRSDFSYLPPEPSTLRVPATSSKPQPQQNASKFQPPWFRRQALQLFAGGMLGFLILLGLIRALSQPATEKAEIALNQGIEQLQAGKPEAALKTLNRSVQLDPRNAAAVQQRGNAYYDLGNYDQAITDYTQTIQLNPDGADAYLNRGLILQDQGDLAGAIADYTRVIQLQPQDADAYYQRGLAHLAQGQYQAAIADHTEVIRLQPQEPSAYRARGTARIQAGELQQGMADYTKAIQLKPDNAAAYYDRGRARFHLGDYSGALGDYDRVIKLEPNNGEAYGNRCSTQINLFEHQAAVADCTKAIELAPNPVAYNNRCVAYLNLKQADQAVADCSKAIELAGNDEKAYGNRGLAYSQLGQSDRAISDYTKATELNPNDAEAYSNRAAAYGTLENYNQAINDYIQAIRLKPDYAVAYAGRGNIRVKLGDKAGAISDFQKAGELYLEQGLTGGYKDSQYQIDQLKQK